MRSADVIRRVCAQLPSPSALLKITARTLFNAPLLEKEPTAFDRVHNIPVFVTDVDWGRLRVGVD